MPGCLLRQTLQGGKHNVKPSPFHIIQPHFPLTSPGENRAAGIKSGRSAPSSLGLWQSHIFPRTRAAPAGPARHNNPPTLTLTDDRACGGVTPPFPSKVHHEV
jgi:hypothetical protein